VIKTVDLRSESKASPRDGVHAARWRLPEDRDANSLIDYHLYGEVLRIALGEPFITPEKLSSPEEGLRNRFRKFLLLQKPTQTNVRGLLSILARFGWLRQDETDRLRFIITEEGRTVAALSQSDEVKFRRLVAQRLNERYVIPAWFIARLYTLNPSGQGEVVLPAPRRGFVGERRNWKDSAWTPELHLEALEAARTANRLMPGSFPLNEGTWLKSVRSTWNDLASGKPPRNSRAKTGLGSGRQTTFGVRGRLLHAMREATVELMLCAVPPGGHKPDFSDLPQPIHPRAFKVWCPRLSELEFIFYTDYHPAASGRIIVPCGAFRSAAPADTFEKVEGVSDAAGKPLFLFRPSWNWIRESFLAVLLESYQAESKRLGAFYVSLLAVRDEVCRRLRLSADLFDELIEIAYEETLRDISVKGRLISISLESDMRPEQRNAVGLNQRPVYVQKVPQSLIAIRSSKT